MHVWKVTFLLAHITSTLSWHGWYGATQIKLFAVICRLFSRIVYKYTDALVYFSNSGTPPIYQQPAPPVVLIKLRDAQK